jgi:uncharacterized protein YdhG (YjbR/CyaY superfamily)
MSAAEIDAYLAPLPEPKRSTLDEMRRRILTVIPDAEQGLSYGMPVFKVAGRPVAGLAAFRDHLSYLPHSGSVLAALDDELAGFERTPGSLHFGVDEPLPPDLIRRLVEVKLQQLEEGPRRGRGSSATR